QKRRDEYACNCAGKKKDRYNCILAIGFVGIWGGFLYVRKFIPQSNLVALLSFYDCWPIAVLLHKNLGRRNYKGICVSFKVAQSHNVFGHLLHSSLSISNFGMKSIASRA